MTVYSKTSSTRNSRWSQITSSWGGLELESLRDIEIGINVCRVIQVTDFIHAEHLFTLLFEKISDFSLRFRCKILMIDHILNIVQRCKNIILNFLYSFKICS